jgi:leucyl aminopeptidase (aminopeptidase T)
MEMYGGAAILYSTGLRLWGDWQTEWKFHNLRLYIDLNVDSGDVVTIGTVPEFPQVWNEVIAALVAEKGAEPVIVSLSKKRIPYVPPWEDTRIEPGSKAVEAGLTTPKNVVAAIENSDVYVVTGGPGIQLRGDIAAALRKTRVVGAHTIAGPQEAFRRFTMDDMLDIRDTTFKVCNIVNNAKTFRLVTGEGEELTGKLRKAWAVQTDSHTNIYPYTVAGMPTDTGEAMIAVVEEETEGTLVVDGYVNYLYPLGTIKRSLKFTIKHGRVVKGPEPEDDEMAKAIKKMLATNNDPDNSVLCELGIGTNRYNNAYPLVPNPYCEMGNVVKKGLGRVHIAFGENTNIGSGHAEVAGKNEASVHFDCTILKPTLYLDDKLLIKAGKPIF